MPVSPLLSLCAEFAAGRERPSRNGHQRRSKLSGLVLTGAPGDSNVQLPCTMGHCPLLVHFKAVQCLPLHFMLRRLSARAYHQ